MLISSKAGSVFLILNRSLTNNPTQRNKPPSFKLKETPDYYVFKGDDVFPADSAKVRHCRHIWNDTVDFPENNKITIGYNSCSHMNNSLYAQLDYFPESVRPVKLGGAPNTIFDPTFPAVSSINFLYGPTPESMNTMQFKDSKAYWMIPKCSVEDSSRIVVTKKSSHKSRDMDTMTLFIRHSEEIYHTIFDTIQFLHTPDYPNGHLDLVQYAKEVSLRKYVKDTYQVYHRFPKRKVRYRFKTSYPNGVTSLTGKYVSVKNGKGQPHQDAAPGRER